MTQSSTRARTNRAAVFLSLALSAAVTACGGGAHDATEPDAASALDATSSAQDAAPAAAAPVARERARTLALSAPAEGSGEPQAPSGGYGAPADPGTTDDPLVDGVTYAGQVFYIDCDAGDDARDGRSPSTAWRTVTQVNTKTRVGYWDTVKPNSNTTPQFHAPWTAAPSGSAFLFKRGCAFDGFINVHGATFTGTVATFSENITFGAYGSSELPRPKIVYATPSTLFKGMLWSNKHTVHVKNLHFVGNAAVVGFGLYLRDTRDSSVSNTVIEGIYGDGINADNTVNMLVRQSSVLRTQQGGGRGGGLVGSGTNLQVLNSTFVDNGRDKIGAHNIYVRHLHGALFEGNSLSGGSNLGIVLHGTSDNVVIRANDIFGNSNGIDVTGGYTAEAEVFDRITIENNRIRDNGYRAGEQGYGLLLKSMVNSSIHNNLVHGNRLGSLNMADANAGDAYSANVQIYQNLFQDPGTGSNVVFNGAALSQIDVRNNILVQMSPTRTALSKSQAVPEAALILDHNLYYGTGNVTGRIVQYNGSPLTLAQLTAMTQKEMAGRYADPAFVDVAGSDFRVGSISPARQQGAALGVLKDFTGVARSTVAPTVGAHE
jgi:hypothetical protein